MNKKEMANSLADAIQPRTTGLTKGGISNMRCEHGLVVTRRWLTRYVLLTETRARLHEETRGIR